MLVTVVAVLCHLAAGQHACIERVVTDSNQSDVTLAGCQMSGMVGIADWKARHPTYHSDEWSVEGFKCVLGSYFPKREA